MAYKAKVIRVRDLIKHPDADRLQLLKYNGMQFVVGTDIQVDDLVVLFPTDGQLSHNFCHYNNLYRNASKNKDTDKSGFFEDNRKVRAQPFRKQKSEGFVCGLSAFDYVKYDLSKILVEGAEFDRFGNEIVCEKFVTEATRQTIASRGRRSNKQMGSVEYSLKRHFDTAQLAYEIDRITGRSLVIITEKLHGTSARTGNVKVEKRVYSRFANLINRITKREVLKPSIVGGYQYVTGTRSTIANDRTDITDPKAKEYYRWEWHNWIAPLLNKGETVYYEIVGYDCYGSPIMNTHNLESASNKDLVRRYGKQIVYSYGCAIDNINTRHPRNKAYIYRITIQNEDGIEYELPWFEVEKRAGQLGVPTVPVLKMLYINEEVNAQEIIKNEVSSILTDGPSTLDSHLMEGVCVRVESNPTFKVLKDKNYWFKVLEGIVKEKDIIDTEEIS